MKREELADIELNALHRARELLEAWEEFSDDRLVPVAHAYAALALAAGHRIARTEGLRVNT